MKKQIAWLGIILLIPEATRPLLRRAWVLSESIAGPDMDGRVHGSQIAQKILEIQIRQKKSWVDTGSGSLPSE
jgi:hypothetical protein